MKNENENENENEEMVVAVKPQFAIVTHNIINTHFFHRNIWTHNWPAPNVSGFIAQLVEYRTGKSRGHGFNPRWSPEFFF